MSATAGWYPDTESHDEQRYWDGEGWTDQRRQTPSANLLPPDVPSDRRSTGKTLAFTALALLLFWLVSSVGSAVVTESIQAGSGFTGMPASPGVAFAATVFVGLIVLGILEWRRFRSRGRLGIGRVATYLLLIGLAVAVPAVTYKAELSATTASPEVQSGWYAFVSYLQTETQTNVSDEVCGDEHESALKFATALRESDRYSSMSDFALERDSYLVIHQFCR